MSITRRAVRLGLPLALAAGLLALPSAAFAVGPDLPIPAQVPTPALPLPAPTLPLPTPSLPVPTPSLPLPTPSLPVPTPTLPLPTPSLPVPAPSPPAVLPGSPSPSPPATPAATPGAGPGPVAQPPGPEPATSPTPSTVGLLQTRPSPGAGGSRPPGGGGGSKPEGLVLLPMIVLPAGALGVTLAVAIAVLPLLLAMGLLLLGRIWGEARRLRSARLRLALAADLELKPRELALLSPEGLLKLRDQVAFDELTGVLRRAAGIASVEREIARARRARSSLVAAFIDVDGLKRINDSRGHLAGDQLLRGVASLLNQGLRRQDLVFRYGGDEFVCLLPNIDLDTAEAKLRDLRARAVEGSLAFSFGAASLRDEDDLVSFLGRADQMLYDSRSKRSGEVSAGTVIPLQPPDGRGSGRRRPRRAV